MIRVRRGLGVALVLAGLLLAVTSTALSVGATPGPPPAYVTDYANYPGNAGVPAGCEAPGVTDATFSLNGSPPVATLGELPPVQAGGNTVTMSWTGVTPACVGAPIVLVVKDSPAPYFDETALQPAVSPFEVQTLVAGPGSMSFVLPSLADLRPDTDCFYQLDAILGAPLFVVGPLPNGNFYGSSLRNDGGPNLLISSKNGGYETCSSTRTGSSTTTPGSTTTAPPTTTTEPGAPPTTEPPASTPTTVAGQSAQAVQAAQTRVIPTTGGRNLWAAPLGLAGVLLGLVLIALSRRRQISA